MSVWNSSDRHIEVHTGVTNASGQLSVTYQNSFPGTHAIIPAVLGGPVGRSIRVISQSPLGCVIQVDARNSVDILGISVVSSTSAPVSGQAVSVTVVARE